MHLVKRWHVNIPSLIGNSTVGFDDADIDSEGRLHICDSANGQVYRLYSDGSGIDTFDVMHSRDSVLSIAVMPDSSFCIADVSSSIIARYDENGAYMGDFGLPGVISICSGTEGTLHAIAKYGYEDAVYTYDMLGSPISTILLSMDAPHDDPALINMDADSKDCIYLTYGISPYTIWRIDQDGRISPVFERDVDQPSDTVLIADIAVNRHDDKLWALLAYREYGRQIIDVYNLRERALEPVLIPACDSLYGIICVFRDYAFLMDTDVGVDSGNALCFEIC